MLSNDRRRHLRLPIIDRCLQASGTRWSARQLLEKVNEYLLECDQAPVTIRTIQKDLAYLESLPHNPAPLAFSDSGRVRYYHYSDRDYDLEAPAVSADQAFALEMSYAVLKQLKGFPMIEELRKLRRKLEKQVVNLKSGGYPMLLFEANPNLKGIELLEPLFEAITAGTVLQISYLPFATDSPIEKTIHPWWLKQSNARWFLFGWDDQLKRLDNSPLDRILSISPLSLAYIPNSSLDPLGYFEPLVGVTKMEGEQPVTVLLKVAEKRAHYIVTKPIHPSQLELEPCNGYRHFQLEAIINRELMSLLLSFGADLEVLEPTSLRDSMRQEMQAAAANYSKI